MKTFKTFLLEAHDPLDVLQVELVFRTLGFSKLEVQQLASWWIGEKQLFTIDYELCKKLILMSKVLPTECDYNETVTTVINYFSAIMKNHGIDITPTVS